MKKPRYWLLGLAVAAMAVVLGATNVYVAIRWANVAVSLSVMAMLMVVFVLLIGAWWRAECGVAGMSTAFPDRKSTLTSTAWLVGMLAIAGVESIAYGLTHSRVIEAIVGIALSVPSVYVAGKRVDTKVFVRSSPAEASSFHFLSYLMLAMPLPFAAFLALLLSERHLDGILDFDVALGFAVIGGFPVAAYFIHRRYLKARALIDAPT